MNYFLSKILDTNHNWYILYLLVGLFVIIFFIWYLFLKFSKTLFPFYSKTFKFIKNKLLSSPNLSVFVSKHQKSAKILKNRTRKDTFLGLSLTILFFLIIYILTAYIGFTDAVLDGDLITQIDIRLSDFFYYFKDPRLIDLFLFISYFGSTIIVLLVILLTTIFLFLRGKKIEIIGLLISVGSSGIIALLTKVIIKRHRPGLAVYLENGFSFPSFHATISISLYAYIIWLFIVKTKKIKNKINLAFIGIIIGFLIGLSRMYLNVHYLSDVISGWYLGTLGLAFGITLNGYLKHKSKFKKIVILKKYKKNINVLIILFFISFSVFYYKFYYDSISFTNTEVLKYKQIENVENIWNENNNLKYTETIIGRETESINFVFIVKNEEDLINIFKKSGWEEADKLSRSSIKNMGKALVDKTQYENAPITPLFWNKKIQDLGFQKDTADESIKYRHHIRVWNSGYKLGENYIYVGCGVYDDGLKWGITHKIDPNIDKEREFIYVDLNKSGLINTSKKTNILAPYKGKNFSGDMFYTDGNIYILKIK